MTDGDGSAVEKTRALSTDPQHQRVCSVIMDDVGHNRIIITLGKNAPILQIAAGMMFYDEIRIIDEGHPDHQIAAIGGCTRPVIPVAVKGIGK